MTNTECTVASSYIGYNPAGDIVAFMGQPFELSHYSRMKYGSQLYARTLGFQLAHDLLAEAKDIMLDSRPLVALITYKYVPSAAATITRATIALLTEARLNAGLSAVELVHVQSGKVLGRDYSSLSEADRAAYIAETGYQLRDEEVAGANVLVIDDIRNTGAAEKLVRGLLVDKSHAATVFAYLAIMDEESGRRDPKVENRINTATIKTLDDLRDIVAYDGMTLTIRTMKMVLGEKDHTYLRAFLNALPLELVYQIYSGSLGSGPEFLDHYRDGFNVLRDVAVRRGLPLGQ